MFPNVIFILIYKDIALVIIYKDQIMQITISGFVYFGHSYPPALVCLGCYNGIPQTG